MTEDRALPFSQREGDEPLPAPLQLGELPSAARTMIWNVLYMQMQKTRHVGALGGVWKKILWAKHIHVDALPVDEWNDSFVDKCDEIKGRIREDPFNRVFDLIEFIMRHRDCPPEFINDVSLVFRHFQLAYIIDSRPPVAILPAATVEEGNELKRNLAELRTSGLVGCATHLRNASKCINDGDWAGSVRESIHAVEFVARQITDPAATLGKALHLLEQQGVLRHKALKGALSQLYGWTSSKETGIRHALPKEGGADITIDEAVLMLGACASFARYLWRKHKAATAP